jgi:XapX domain-containing protein
MTHRLGWGGAAFAVRNSKSGCSCWAFLRSARMRDYLEALAVGVTVGVIYGMLKFRSPAPPLIALVGLLGMLIGEQLIGVARAHFWSGGDPTVGAPTPSQSSAEEGAVKAAGSNLKKPL